MSENILKTEAPNVVAEGAAQLGRLVQVRERGARKVVTGPAVSTEQRKAIRGLGYGRRKMTNRLVFAFSVVCAVIALIPLFAITLFVVVQGISSFSPSFFVHAQAEVNPTDLLAPPLGIGNTIVGTLLLVLVASVIGLPIGLFSGLYLAEYGRNSRFANAVRFIADVVAGLPSIVAGMVGYALIVVTMHGFSALAGGFALALLMFPVVTRATEEVLRLVPDNLREGGMALGIPRWRIVASIVLPTASSGIITAMLLGVARVTGETAPLLFTSFGNPNWEINPLQPVGALTYTIFDYSLNQAGEGYHRYAYAGALVLVLVVVLLNVGARALFRQRVRGRT